MVRKFVALAVSTALFVVPVASASAQDYRFAGFDAPAGATATANFKLTLGGKRAAAKPTYGLTLGYGHTVGAPTLDGRTTTRSLKLADLRFNEDGLKRAEVASFNLLDLKSDPRFSLAGDDGEKDSTTYFIIGGLALVAIGILVFSGGDDDDDDEFDDD